MKIDLIMPNSAGMNQNEIIKLENNMVLIGANGAGKSKLGAWIEQNMQNQVIVHRIGAHKALNIPEFAQLKNLEQAEKDLLWGRNDEHASVNRKVTDRWGSNPTTFLLNDFDKLLSLLFAKTIERDRKHTHQTQEKGKYVEVDDAPIDIIVKVWSDIMPHRNILFKDGKVLVSSNNTESLYHGKEMSDGERVTLYLLGQCLCAPKNSIIIIDEPEIHLHKSLVDKLWNKIEELSQDKLLIYITHDIDFASSRTDANKFWIQSFNGNNLWKWQEVHNDDVLPNELMLEILGSRKNIIFCEGEKGSLDTTIYQIIYPDFHVIPRGSGDKVIEATMALRSNTNIHHLNVYGLIDSDYKEEDEKEALKRQGIYTISVAEIENIFCVEPVLRIISEQLELNPDEIVDKVIDFLVKSLRSEFEVQVSSKAEKIIEYKLGAYSKRSNSKQGLIDGLKETLNRIDIDNIYEEIVLEYNEAIEEENLKKLLLLYNRKSLIDRISPIFELGNGQYSKFLVRSLKGKRKQDLISAIKSYLPQFDNPDEES